MIGLSRIASRGAALLATVLLCAGSSPALAAHPLRGDAKERELLGSLAQKKFIRAREQAEKILRREPTSIIARFGLARVFHLEEANLPRALHHMRRAERELLSRYGKRPRDPLAQRWHRRILMGEEAILGEMDRRKQQLAVLERHDRLYKPAQKLQRIWPLMKLHRFKEATKIARRATLSSDLQERISGYNGLLSIEFERERPRACFRVAMEAISATGRRSCILALNTAEAAFAVFRFADAERLALESLKAELEDCPASAHPHLANLYLLRGDFRRAIAAVRDARKEGVPRRLRQQFETGITAWLTRLLYALGQFEKAYELGGRVVQRPDRVGLISYSREQMEAIYTIDHYVTQRAQLERLRERASARPFLERAKLWAEIKRLELASWFTRRRIAKLLATDQMLVSLLRPYLKPLPSWNLPELGEIAGAGVVARGLHVVRRKLRMKKQVEPYFAAMEGELAYRRGDLSAAEARAREALGGLPRDERLLRGRVAAWAADAAYRRGKLTRARARFHRVMHRWPTALRILSIRLPASIRSSKDELARAIADKLQESRRLRPVDGARSLGFVVDVHRRGKAIELCLLGKRGRRYACAAPSVDKAQAWKKAKQRDERVALAIDAFHDTIFAPLIDLTQQDINSLDGSAVRGRADRVLRDVLGR